ncbi:MAG: general secretion pathway protein GspL [Tatlockia sp.]|nr:general secretion pathway protein GspL [Tatlockia sp.]
MAILFLFTQYLNEEGCLSLKLDQQGQLDAPVAQRSFAEIKLIQNNSQTYIVAPARYFSLLKLSLPWLAEKKARAAIPFALEDKLAQNFDTLHFAFDSNHYQNGQYLVAIADKNYLSELIKIFDNQNINFNLLTIDWFALKSDELAIMESYLLINDDNYQGALEPDLAPFYLVKGSDKHQIYCFTDSGKGLFDLPGAEFVEIESISYLWLAQRLVKTRPMNLCQGALQHGNGPFKTRRLYQATAAMCLIWIFSSIAMSVLKLHSLNKELASVDNHIAQIYREFFPQAKQIINPKFRVGQLLKISQNITDTAFWLLLDNLSENFQENSANIEKINYQNQTLTVNLETNNFANLENLQNKLQQNKIKVRQTQASSRDEKVISTLELHL